MKVVWENVPLEVRAALEPLLDKWLWILPPWCQEFRVDYKGGQDATMSVTVSYRNRWAVLHATGLWLGEKEQYREVSVIHELVHVLLEPMVSAVARVIEDTTPAGTPLRNLADSVFSDGMEASTEDMARALQRRDVA